MKPQVILVTGASTGIGEAAARRLARAGHTVYAGARRVERMKPLEAEGVRTLFLDVTDDVSMKAAVARIEKEAGGVDVLVNNAGYGSYGAIEDVPIDEGRAQFEVNVFGLARMSQLVLPGMRQKKAGRIINISSIGGRITLPLGSWYHASKHAVEGLSDCLRQEVRDFGIHVSVIQPGGTESEWAKIAADNVLKTSGQGAYATLAQGMASIMNRENAGGTMAQVPADVIAVLIQKATESPRPKTRYVGPGMAKVLLAARRWLSDRSWDNVIAGMARSMAK
jgi:NAD(P)-dependent dehydrogenase (short-subunit alcohol dehydrogenase family)